MILLLKARKPSGEGTTKKYPSGLIYKKQGKKWVYVAKAGTKKGDEILEEAKKKGLYIEVGGKPEVKQEPEEKKEPEKKIEPEEKKEEPKAEPKVELKVEPEPKKEEPKIAKKNTWDYLKTPTYDDFVARAEERWDEAWLRLSYDGKKSLEEHGIKSYSDFFEAARDPKKFDLLRTFFAQNTYKFQTMIGFYPISMFNNLFYELSTTGLFLDGYAHTYKLDRINAGREGLEAKFTIDGHRLPFLNVPYDNMEGFFKVNPIDPKDLKRLKQNPYYQTWQSQGGDPTVTKALENFTKTTGLEISTDSTCYGRSGTQLKESYIKVLDDTFKEVNKYLTINKYVPPDGAKLKVRLIRAGKGYKGWYLESDKTINISPSLPGTIVHELGHYFWERSVDMQKDFKDWVREVGLDKKITEAMTYKKLDSARMNNHIDETFNLQMKLLFETLPESGEYKDKLAAGKIDKESLNKGLFLISNMARHIMKNNNGVVPHTKDLQFPYHSTDAIGRKDDNSIQQLAAALHTAIPDAVGNSIDDTIQTLKSFRESIKNLDPAFVKTRMDDKLYYMMHDADRLTVEDKLNIHTSWYAKKPGYWNKWTEIFARTLRAYVAKKAGIPDFKTSDEAQIFARESEKGIKKIAKERKKKYTGVKIIEKYKGSDAGPIGWGFPEVDPSFDMIDKDGKLEAMLKKYLGNDVIKAILEYRLIIMKSKIRKAKPYPDGTIRKWSGRAFQKKGKIWVRVKDGKVIEKKEEKSKVSRKMNGTKEMYAALKEVNGKKSPILLDDLKGDKRKTFNSITKMGLIKWQHVGSEEYKAFLTDGGVKALNHAQALEKKILREANKK